MLILLWVVSRGCPVRRLLPCSRLLPPPLQGTCTAVSTPATPFRLQPPAFTLRFPAIALFN